MRTLFGYHLFALSLALATSARTEAQQVFGDLHVVANSLDGALDVWPMDVDEDGDQDLLLYNSFRHALTWCSNKGSGTFSPAQWIDTTLSTYAFGTVADMDGDGHLDPVVVSDDGRLSYIPRINGTTFGPPVVFATGLGTTVKDIVSVDLDDDGDTDIVASLGTSGPFGSAYWLNDGMGDLGSPHVLLQPADGIGLIVADLNNDGLPDVCTVTNGVLVRYLNQGNGTFGAADFIFNDSALIAGLAVEANGDGIEDILLLLDTGDILLGLNDGSSTYLNYTTVASGFTHFHFWNAADLNGDGRDDLCITSFDLPVQVNVLLNAGNGSWPTVTPAQPDPSRYIARWHAGDMNGDGAPDLVMVTSQELAGYLTNDGSGHFISNPVLAPVQRSNRWIHGADVDGDGHMDLMTGAPYTGNGRGRAGWYPYDGTPEMGPFQPIGVGETESDAHLALDVEGDGDMDLLVGVVNQIAPWRGFGLYRNNGNGFDAPEVLSPANDTPIRVWLAAGDPNGDGLPDAMYTSYAPNQDGWYRNNAGTLEQGGSVMYATWPTLLRNEDMDGDGDRDFILRVSTWPDQVYWRPNNGTGDVVDQYHTVVPGTDPCTYYVIDDPDQDGDADVLASMMINGENMLRWYWNDGNGAFNGYTDLGIAVADGVPFITGLVNADARPDVVCTLADGTVDWIRNDGGGQFSTPIPIDGLSSGSAFELMDFDGDQDNDLLVIGHDGLGGVAWLEGTSDLALASANTQQPGPSLLVAPSIVRSATTVLLPESVAPDAQIQVLDAQGRMVMCAASMGARTVRLDMTPLDAGTYSVLVTGKVQVALHARIVVER